MRKSGRNKTILAFVLAALLAMEPAGTAEGSGGAQEDGTASTGEPGTETPGNTGAGGLGPNDGSTEADGTDPDDSSTEGDGTNPDDGSTEGDGTNPDDGSAEEDGTNPDDGSAEGNRAVKRRTAITQTGMQTTKIPQIPVRQAMKVIRKRRSSRRMVKRN